MFDRPILLFSEYCIHSKNFLVLLHKHTNLYNTFIRLNVDVDPRTKQRTPLFYKIQQELNRKIKSVPTIIVLEQTEQGPQVFVLSDKEAFKWLDYKTQPQREQGLLGFNINEMGSFSDKYSNYGSTDLNDATEQNYKFYQEDISGKKVLKGEQFQHGEITGHESFKAPDDNNNSSNTQTMYNNMENERQQSRSHNRQGVMGHRELQSIQANSEQKVNSSDFNARLNNYKQESGQLRGNQRQQIDFTNPNFGLAAKIGGNNTGNSGSLKQKELDARLSQLMSDRNAL